MWEVIYGDTHLSSTAGSNTALDLVCLVQWNKWNSPKSASPKLNQAHLKYIQVYGTVHYGSYPDLVRWNLFVQDSNKLNMEPTIKHLASTDKDKIKERNISSISTWERERWEVSMATGLFVIVFTAYKCLEISVPHGLSGNAAHTLLTFFLRKVNHRRAAYENGNGTDSWADIALLVPQDIQ